MITAQDIIDYLDPNLFKCYECHEFSQLRSANTVMLDDGRDVLICGLCSIDLKKDEHADFIIGELDPDQRFCDICEKYKPFDEEWEERKNIWLMTGPPSILIYMSHIECSWFCEGCAEILQDKAEEHDKQLCA